MTENQNRTPAPLVRFVIIQKGFFFFLIREIATCDEMKWRINATFHRCGFGTLRLRHLA